MAYSSYSSIPSNYTYYEPNYNYPIFTHGRSSRPIASRFIPGGFVVPFALGFLTAPLVFNSGYNKPYPPYYNQYNYYPNY